MTTARLNPSEQSGRDMQRYEFAHQLRESGKTFKEIGETLGVSNRRAEKMVADYKRWLAALVQHQGAWWFGLKRATVSLLLDNGITSKEDCRKTIGANESEMRKRIGGPNGRFCYITWEGASISRPLEIRVFNEVRAWLGMEALSWPNTNLQKPPIKVQPLKGERTETPRRIGRYKLVWTPDIEAQLGKVSDREIAEKLGVPLYVVANHRKFLGIAAIGKAFEWSPDIDAFLGTNSDKVIGHQLGLSADAVCKRRNFLNIDPYVKRASSRIWTPDQDVLLGTEPDNDLATKWGVPTSAVRKRRYQKNIPGYKSVSRWTPQMDALIGTMSDLRLANKLGLSYDVVRLRRIKLGINKFFQKIWTTENVALLGAMSDNELAMRLGVSVSSVAKYRRKIGIKMHDKS